MIQLPAAAENPEPLPSGYIIAESSDSPDGRTSPAACRSAQWDPTTPDAVGAALDDGSFQYMDPSCGGVRQMRLYPATVALGAWPQPGDDKARLPPPNRAPWAHWVFVPGRRTEVLFVQAFSKQLLLATLPQTTHPQRVMLSRDMPRPAMVSALDVCALGEWAGVGQADGTVTFFLLGSMLGGLPRAGGEGMLPSPLGDCASEHVMAHGGAVTCLRLMRAVSAESGVEAALGCTGAADQTLIVWDVRARAPLHRLLTANPTAVTALCLALLPPGSAETGGRPEPAVLVVAGSADGGLQAWALHSHTPPELRATWRHRIRAPLAAIAHIAAPAPSQDSGAHAAAGGASASGGGGRLLCVSHGPGMGHGGMSGYSDGHCDGEAEGTEGVLPSATRAVGMNECDLIEEVMAGNDWPLRSSYRLRDGEADSGEAGDGVVSAHFASSPVLTTGTQPTGTAVDRVRLLIASRSGGMRCWQAPEPLGAASALSPHGSSRVAGERAEDAQGAVGAVGAVGAEGAPPPVVSRRVSPPKGPRMPRAWTEGAMVEGMASMAEDYVDDDGEAVADADTDEEGPRCIVPLATRPLDALDAPPTLNPTRSLSAAGLSAPLTVPLPPHPHPHPLPPEPTPLRHARFDNPYRVLALLEAGGAAGGVAGWTAGGEGADLPPSLGAAVESSTEDEAAALPSAAFGAALAHPLSRPALYSSAQLQERQRALESQTFEEEALPAVEGELRRRARRDATAELNTPAAQHDRYGELTPLADPEPTTAPAAAPSARLRRRVHENAHSEWRTRRALEPALEDLFTADREVEVLDTARDTSLPCAHAVAEAHVHAATGGTAVGTDAPWSAAFCTPPGVAAPLVLGAPRPLVLHEPSKRAEAPR